MFLPVFNLTEEEIALLKNKFYFLRASTLKTINELVERINTSENLFQLNEAEKNQLKLRNQILRERKEHLASGMEQTTGSVTLPIEAKITWLEWLKNQHRYLCSEKTLPRLVSLSPLSKQDALKAAWESWEKHSALAYHTNQSLVEMTTVLLPRLIEHHREAKAELQKIKDKIPASIRTKFSVYLDQFEKSSQLLLIQCRHSMMARFETFARSKQSCSQPVIGMIGQLQFYGLVDKKTIGQVSQVYIEPLTSEQFNVFHHEIAKETALKSRLDNLPWLRTQQKMPSTLVQTDSSTYIAPQFMAARIPPRKKRPRWLFRGHNIRASFYKSKGLLLAQLNKSLTLTDDVKNTEQFNHLKNVKNFLSDWENTDNSLLRETLNISKKRKKLWSVFQNDTHQFLTEWQELLFNWRLNVLTQQLTVIENLLNFIETKINGLEPAASVFQHCESLQKMLDLSHRTNTIILTKLTSPSNLSSTEIQKLQELKQKQEKLTQSSENILGNLKSIRIFKRLASGNEVSQSELAYYVEWCEALRQNNTNLEAFVRTYSTEIELIENQFKVKLRDIQNVPKNKSLIISLFKLLETIGSDGDQKHHSQLTQKYFLAYLKQLSLCTINKKERLENILSAMEEVLTTVAPHQLFAGIPFKLHVERFKDLRKTKGKMTHLQALAEGCASTLASELVQKRLEKDIDVLEAQIEKIMIDKLPGQQNIMNLLLQMSNRLVEAKQAHLEDIETSFSESDRVLAGLKSQELRPIKELIELHAFAKQTQAFCHSTSHYTAQWKRLNELKQEGQKTFANHPWALQFTLGKTKSGRNMLFHKTYWEPQGERLKQHSLSL